MSFAGLLDSFQNAIDPPKTKLFKLPQRILVFGGQARVDLPRHISCRNVFLAKSIEINHPLSKHFSLPEDFPEWNQMEGYANLVHFELDAGCLARAIVLFAETYGSIAELGAFSMDDAMCERLLVVIERKYVNAADSFIFLGPITRIREINDDHAICGVDNLESVADFENEVPDVLAALSAKLDAEIQHPLYRATRRRDQFLLIADLVDLFRALTKSEILELLSFMGVAVLPPDLKRMLWQLALFGFLRKDLVYGTTYYVSIKGADNQFLNYEARLGEKPFSRTNFKAQVHSVLLKDQRRRKAYAEVGGA